MDILTRSHREAIGIRCAMGVHTHGNQAVDIPKLQNGILTCVGMGTPLSRPSVSIADISNASTVRGNKRCDHCQPQLYWGQSQCKLARKVGNVREDARDIFDVGFGRAGVDSVFIA